MIGLAVVLCSIICVVDGQPQLQPQIFPGLCPGGSCPPQGGLFCLWKGQFYTHGQEVSNDGCNICTCSNGQVGCTERACLCGNGKPPLPDFICNELSECPSGYICDTSNNPDTASQNGYCCEPAFCEDGQRKIPHGESFMDDCNTCQCDNGRIICTLIACPPKCRPGYIPHPTDKCGGIAGLLCPEGYECDMSHVPEGTADALGNCCKLDCKALPEPCPRIVDCAPENIFTPPGQCCPICKGPVCKDGNKPLPSVKCEGFPGLIKGSPAIIRCPAGYICDKSNNSPKLPDLPGICCRPTCIDEGIIRSDGEVFLRDCNTCRCSNGNILCTRKLCPDCRDVQCAKPRKICLKPYTPPGECCPRCIDCSAVSCVLPVGCSREETYTPPGECCPRCKATFCEVNGKRIENGVLFPVDCNTCQCVDGQVICTLIACEPKCENGNKPLPGIRCEGVPGISRCPAGFFCDTSNNSPGSPELPGICCKPICRDGGITRKDGEVFLRDCNTCRCSNGQILCTRRICPDCRAVLCVEPPCLNPYTPPGECCPRCKDCSAVLCVKPVGCLQKDFYIPPGECCPRCKGTCEVNGKWIENGVSFPVDCNTCQCVDGQIFCTLIACAPQCKPGFVAHPEAKCGGIAGLPCPKGFNCDTSHIPKGTADAFGICCRKSADCTVVRCGIPVDCPEDFYTPIGQCCPVCLPRKCKNGKKRLPGERCGGSTGLKCKTRNVCDTSLIQKGSADFGVCCKGRSCMEKGKKIRHGKQFMRDCNRCTCIDGQAACTKKGCPGKPGKTCTYKDKVYKEGQTTGDYCHTCTCTNGVMLCPDKALCVKKRPCKTADGSFLKHGEKYSEYCNTCTCNDGKIGCTKNLCATNKPCSYKGHTYTHSQTFLDVCNTCRCANGNVSCTEKICKVCPPTCPQLRCANQVTLKGACCPTCVPGGY